MRIFLICAVSTSPKLSEQSGVKVMDLSFSLLQSPGFGPLRRGSTPFLSRATHPGDGPFGPPNLKFLVGGSPLKVAYFPRSWKYSVGALPDSEHRPLILLFENPLEI